MAVPPGAVPGLLDPAERSSWQLALEVWEQSGVSWERPAIEPGADPAFGWLPDPDPLHLRPGDDHPSFQPFDADPGLPARERPNAGALSVDARDGDARDGDPDPDRRIAVDAAVPGPRAFDAASLGAWPDNAEPAGAEPVGAEPVGGEPPGGEPAGGEARPDGPEPEEVPPADTWFSGTGPADARLAGAQAADAGRSGEGPALIGTGPYFADSGVESLTSEFPPRRPRRPEFSPADELWAAQQTGRDNEARPATDPLQADPAERPAYARRPQPTWTEHPRNGFGWQLPPAGSGQVPLSAPVALALDGPESLGLLDGPNAEAEVPADTDGAASRWGSAASLSEPDELFRAWQGSVDRAAAGRGSWSGPRRGAPASRRRRALQVAAIGVPAAVIVTVGAGALMMLTGKANDMLAVQADTGSPAAHATGTSGATAGASASAAARPPAFVSATLSGYPGQRGSATVASMLAAAGRTLAVGTADRHPAIWRRAASGSWTLESMATLGLMSGGTGLTSVAHGPAGWLAVGTASEGRATAPVVFASADGAHWQPVTGLTGQAGPGTVFLGAAAGAAGYVAVGRQMIGGRAFAVLWHSADLRSWTAGDNGGLDGRLSASTVNAVAATATGFVAVGSHGAAQAIWTSSDGQHWHLGSLSAPSGADSATLHSVAVNGARVVAGGFAAAPTGDIPVIDVSADGGAHWRQIMLSAPNGFGVVTALTATPGGFTAAGAVARSGGQHAVTWTSPDGATWSAPADAPGSEITALAATVIATGATASGTAVAGTAEEGAAPTLVLLPAP